MKLVRQQLALREAAAGNRHSIQHLTMLRLCSGDPQSAGRFLEGSISAIGLVDELGFCVLLLSQVEKVNTEGLEDLCLRMAEVDDPVALKVIAEMRAAAGDYEQAEDFALRALTAGRQESVNTLMRIWNLTGRSAVTEQLCEQLATDGISRCWTMLAESRKNTGALEEAERFARNAIAGGDMAAESLLAELREMAGDRDEAEHIIEGAARAGRYSPINDMMALREKNDPAGAEALALRALDWPTNAGIVCLAKIRKHAGDLASADRLALLAADTGWSDAFDDMHSGGEDERWRQLRRFGLNADGSDAAAW